MLFILFDNFIDHAGIVNNWFSYYGVVTLFAVMYMRVASPSNKLAII